VKLNKVLKLLIFIIIIQLVGFIGSIFTTPAIPVWYASIIKPTFTPPNWLFAPVWTILFLLMGISAFMVWQKGIKKRKVKISMLFFGIQLLLNMLWSILFFGFKSPLLAFIEIILLWAFILLTILLFSKVSKKASYLLVPYIIWVSFAAVLNFYILLLN